MKNIYNNVKITDVTSNLTHSFITERKPEIEESPNVSEAGTIFKQEGQLFISDEELGGVNLSQYLIVEYSLGDTVLVWGDSKNPVFASFTHNVFGVQIKMERKSLIPMFR